MTKLRKVRELAERANVNEMTIRRAINRGDLPAVRVGRSIRINEEAFQRFLRPIRLDKEGTK